MPEQPAGSRSVEFIVDGYRVRGEVAVTGGPRRLVDILNALDDLISLHDATLDNPIADLVPKEAAEIAHVHLSTILFAIPHGADVRYEDPFEMVNKVPVPCTIVVPGFEITGNIHMVAEVDPRESQILSTLHFVPLTDAKVITLANPSTTWESDVLVVNMRRAAVYAPHAKSPAIAA